MVAVSEPVAERVDEGTIEVEASGVEVTVASVALGAGGGATGVTVGRETLVPLSAATPPFAPAAEIRDSAFAGLVHTMD